MKICAMSLYLTPAGRLPSRPHPTVSRASWPAVRAWPWASRIRIVMTAGNAKPGGCGGRKGSSAEAAPGADGLPRSHALIGRGEVVCMDSRSRDAHGPTASGRESDSPQKAGSPTRRESLTSSLGGLSTGPAARQHSFAVLAPDGTGVFAWIPRRALGLLGPILRRNGLIVVERSDDAQV